MTLTFDLGGNDACGWCGSLFSIRIASLKFVCLAVRKIWRTMCVGIDGPGDPDLWLFDLETGMQVASKVGNLPSKFGHARPLGSRIIRYVCDGRTKARLISPFPTGAEHNKENSHVSCSVRDRCSKRLFKKSTYNSSQKVLLQRYNVYLNFAEGEAQFSASSHIGRSSWAWMVSTNEIVSGFTSDDRDIWSPRSQFNSLSFYWMQSAMNTSSDLSPSTVCRLQATSS